MAAQDKKSLETLEENLRKKNLRKFEISYWMRTNAFVSERFESHYECFWLKFCQQLYWKRTKSINWVKKQQNYNHKVDKVSAVVILRKQLGDPLLTTINLTFERIKRWINLEKGTTQYSTVKNSKFVRFYLLSKIHKRLHGILDRLFISNSS